jgi:predicted heme/steroid binding protein
MAIGFLFSFGHYWFSAGRSVQMQYYTPTNHVSEQKGTVDYSGEGKKFTLEELAMYNGKNGNAAYIAYNGKVYDVTLSRLWSGGSHQRAHQAGKDLTIEMPEAPHGLEKLDRVKLIGILV